MLIILSEIKEERKRQDKKWGEQNHHPLIWNNILGEEYGEVCKATIEATENDYSKYRKELVEVAAVAVAAIESLDRGKWKEDERT
jgi:NTP pyrophosphatase (non-canonical NTP hydrolase)